MLDFECDTSDFFYPWFVEGHPHVNSWQVRVSTFDAVRNSSGQNPTFVVSLHHQRSTAVTLQVIEKLLKIVIVFDAYTVDNH
jgi:hypothetical protein